MAGRELFQPVEAQTLKENIIEKLSNAIISGKIKLGERLNESQLSRELRVSRAPIREALQQLQQRGLVTNHPRRGMFVVNLDEEDVQKINSLRLVLGSEALRLCKAKLPAHGEKKLVQLVERMEHMQPTAAMQATTIDLEFHSTIWSFTGNEYLENTLASITAPLFAYAILRGHKAEKMRMVLDIHTARCSNMCWERQRNRRSKIMLAHLRLRWGNAGTFSNFNADDATPTYRKVTIGPELKPCAIGLTVLKSSRPLECP